MNFRKVYKNEIEELNLLIKESKGFWGYSEEFCQDFIAKWGVKPDYFNHAEVAVLIDNTATIGIIGMSNDEKYPMLDYFFLKPEYIGKGLGRKMWEEVLRISNKNNWRTFQFYCDPHSEAIYQHFGAKKIGELESFPGRLVPIMEYSYGECQI